MQLSFLPLGIELRTSYDPLPLCCSPASSFYMRFSPANCTIGKRKVSALLFWRLIANLFSNIWRMGSRGSHRRSLKLSTAKGICSHTFTPSAERCRDKGVPRLHKEVPCTLESLSLRKCSASPVTMPLTLNFIKQCQRLGMHFSWHSGTWHSRGLGYNPHYQINWAYL